MKRYLLFLILLFTPSQQAFDGCINKNNLIDHIYNLSTEYDINPQLVFTIITIESNWNDSVVSYTGDIGLMQIRLTTARDYISDITVEDLLDSHINVTIGIQHLNRLMNYYNYNEIKAIVAYNRGQRNVNKMRYTSLLNTKYYKRYINNFN